VSAWLRRLRQWLRRGRDAAHLACGMPDYEQYAAHLRAHHPERVVPSFAEFFRERQAARYGRGRSRCC
jgi:uncharacterized short protein YbdD (DUF466 family)